MRIMLLINLVLILLISSCTTQKKVTEDSTGTSRVFKSNDKISVGSPLDPSLRFIGRWDLSNKENPISYWGGAYIKTKFFGSMVKMRTGHGTNFFVKIDEHPWESFLNTRDTINLTPQPLDLGWHTLTVAQGKDYDYTFDFRGFDFDKKGKTKAPELSPVFVEYIGDSITTGYTDAQANVSDYAWIASEILGTEHAQIAYPGINLASGYGKLKGNGMDVQYMKSRSLKFPDAAKWAFKKYTPQIVTINLGTNDNNNKVPDSVFTRSYITLIKNIRAKFPTTKIFAMRTFLGIKQQATMAAVDQLNKSGDEQVYFLDTTGWIIPNSNDYNDSAHPSVSGQQKAGQMLAEKLKGYL
jgi:lysophospholipase L1-like esterase